MAPTAAINEPFLLSNYSVTHRSSKSSSKSRSPRRQTGVYASYQRPTASSDGFVSVAAQSDGVHVVDVATLHPIISHTLGPFTSFACAPLTLHQLSKNTHTTFGVVASSSDVDAENYGKTIWKWSENLSGPLAERSSLSSKTQHQALVVPHPVNGLYDCHELPDRILAISHAGDISLLTIDLEMMATRPASAGENNVISAHVFSRTSCSFLGSQSEGVIVVLIVERDAAVEIEVHQVGADDLIDSVFSHEAPLESTEIAAVSCSPSGILNIISNTGSWLTFSLTPSAITLISSPVQLKDLTFISPPPSTSIAKRAQSQKKNPTATTSLSLLPLTSSHVLLASQTTNNEIALLLWDSQFPVLLASHILPLPSSISVQASPLSFSLLAPSATGVKAGTQLATLVVSQSASEADGKTPVKSSIYVVPYSVPARSTLANAIGCASAGVRWLASSGSGEKSQNVSPQTKLVANMRTAVEQNRLQAAIALFTEWEKKEQEKMKDGSTEVMFGYTFVKDLLDAVIQPQKPPNPLYSSEVIRHLIEKGVVCSAMLEGGLLACLRLRNDWPTIDLALRYVPDLSENELIETLNVIVNHTSSQTSATDTDAMQVDSIPSTTLDQILSLPGFLATMLKYRQFTAPQLIAAFRHHLRSAEAVTSIVQLLDEWMKKVQSQDVKLLPSTKEITKNEHGVFIIKKDMVKPNSTHDLPTTAQILGFLQSLLDSSFLALLQYPPAHKVLKNLKSHIDPEIAVISQTDQLRGFVEGFARTHAKIVKDAEVGQTGDKNATATGKEGSTKDWRQRKKEMREQVGMTIGVYQLEKLVL